MKKNTTITDLAKKLELNISTVSRALQNHPRISEETRMKVQKMAKKLAYEPNSLASGLRSGHSKSIGIIVPRINRFFFSNVIGGFERIAHENGFNTIICQSNESFKIEQECINTLLKSKVDAIVLSLSAETMNGKHLEKIQKKGVPLLLFDRICDHLKTPSVVLDDYRGGFIATEHLILEGCKKIAFLGGPRHLNVYNNRYSGFCDALKKHGLSLNPQWISFDCLTKEKGADFVTKNFGGNNSPDAIFSASDFSALGAFQQLKEKGFVIPNQIAVVGFANEPFTDFMGISSVEQHPIEMGEKIAGLFFDILLKNVKNPQSSLLIVPELIVRSSSKREC